MNDNQRKRYFSIRNRKKTEEPRREKESNLKKLKLNC